MSDDDLWSEFLSGGVSAEVLIERLRDLAPHSRAWTHARDLLAADHPNAYHRWLADMQMLREALRGIEQAP